MSQDDKTTLRRTANRLGLARKEIARLHKVNYELRRELTQSQRDNHDCNERFNVLAAEFASYYRERSAK